MNPLNVQNRSHVTSKKDFLCIITLYFSKFFYLHTLLIRTTLINITVVCYQLRFAIGLRPHPYFTIGFLYEHINVSSYRKCRQRKHFYLSFTFIKETTMHSFAIHLKSVKSWVLLYSKCTLLIKDYIWFEP